MLLDIEQALLRHVSPQIINLILLSDILQVLNANLLGTLRQLEILMFLKNFLIGVSFLIQELIFERVCPFVYLDCHLELLICVHVNWQVSDFLFEYFAT